MKTFLILVTSLTVPAIFYVAYLCHIEKRSEDSEGVWWTAVPWRAMLGIGLVLLFCSIAWTMIGNAGSLPVH